MKRLVYAGNRPRVLQALLNLSDIQIVRVFGFRPLAQSSSDIVKELAEVEFDVLLSCGLPKILPVSRLRKPHQIFLNLHPSLLPRLRGKHPVNGVLLFREQKAGATLHFMDDGIDTGNIIHQESFPVTPDLDLGLLYQMLFNLEPRVAVLGMQMLAASGFHYEGVPQGPGTNYKDRDKDRFVDLACLGTFEVSKRIAAFGIASQGALARIDDVHYKLFAAEPIVNPHLLAEYADRRPGSLLLAYEGNLLIKTSDGIIKITRFALDMPENSWSSHTVPGESIDHRRSDSEFAHIETQV